MHVFCIFNIKLFPKIPDFAIVVIKLYLDYFIK